MILEPFEKRVGGTWHLYCPWCRKNPRLGIRYENGDVELEPGYEQNPSDGLWRRKRRGHPYMPRGKDIEKLIAPEAKQARDNPDFDGRHSRAGRPFLQPGAVQSHGRRSLSLEDQFKIRGKGGSRQGLGHLKSRYTTLRHAKQDWETSRKALPEGSHVVVCYAHRCGARVQIVVSYELVQKHMRQ